jgi:hypothetical protein
VIVRWGVRACWVMPRARRNVFPHVSAVRPHARPPRRLMRRAGSAPASF